MGILSVRNVSAGYYTDKGTIHVLKNLNADFPEGSFIGITGESGSGKSTLGYILYNFIVSPMVLFSGEVHFAGRDLMGMNEEEIRKIRGKEYSFVPQAAMNSLNPVKNIGYQFKLVLSEHAVPVDRQQDIIEEVLALVRLDHRVLSMFPHELSGGMRQRVVIAMAIMLKPKLIILDEPTTGLDVIVQHELLRDIKELQSKLQLTVIMITHDVAAIFQISDIVYIMYAGYFVEYGNYASMLKKSRHPYTYLLLKSVPSLASGEELVTIPGSPPDLASKIEGCPFYDRCPFAITQCSSSVPEMIESEEGGFRCIRNFENGRIYK
jgi:oligopeptide/dipeptide ABC transporter ATP-binding protein